jgi:hypothetical protein
MPSAARRAAIARTIPKSLCSKMRQSPAFSTVASHTMRSSGREPIAQRAAAVIHAPSSA